jgi:cysteinyl-tRNA synthetase
VCGPTVYDFAHIGNARPVIVFDVLFRLLRRLYGEAHVTYARNITDVEDKINAAAKEQGISIRELTERTARLYREDMAAVGALAPTIEPRATEHIAEMVAMIERLIAGGFAYAAEGHVLFEVKRMPEYGRLSRRSLDDMIAGARVEVAPYKRDPADFVLWKPSDAGTPGWESPWGRGRPGWHIECSAMAEKHLGETFDIHGGGIDLVFPHHENEIAQSVCAHGGRELARVWMHNGFLNIEGDKMSKSLGNFVTVHELLKEWRGETLRYAMLTGHYREPLDWTRRRLDEAHAALDKFYLTLRHAKDVPAQPSLSAKIAEALEDDLNTALALSHMHELAGELNRTRSAEAKGALLGAGGVLGLLQQDPEAWLRGDDADAARIDDLIQQRNAARKAKNFAEADRIRDTLAAEGILLEDAAGTTTWRRKPS